MSCLPDPCVSPETLLCFLLFPNHTRRNSEGRDDPSIVIECAHRHEETTRHAKSAVKCLIHLLVRWIPLALLDSSLG